MRLPIPQSVRFGAWPARPRRDPPPGVVSSVATTLPLLSDASRWPDFGCACGRFTRLCSRW
jgi:hypothetical protein